MVAHQSAALTLIPPGDAWRLLLVQFILLPLRESRHHLAALI
jgi:hypothetical protein